MTYTGGTADLTGGSAYCCVFKALNKAEKRSRATTRRWVAGAIFQLKGGVFLKTVAETSFYEDAYVGTIFVGCR
jgi:hypothetical protein